MESYENIGHFTQEEGVKRCPHCESPLGKNIHSRPKEDNGEKFEEEVHVCEGKTGKGERCGQETILNRKKI